MTRHKLSFLFRKLAPVQFFSLTSIPDMDSPFFHVIAKALPRSLVFSRCLHRCHSRKIVIGRLLKSVQDSLLASELSRACSLQNLQHPNTLDTQVREDRFKEGNSVIYGAYLDEAHTTNLEICLARSSMIQVRPDVALSEKFDNFKEYGIVLGRLVNCNYWALFFRVNASLAIKKACDILKAHRLHVNKYTAKSIISNITTGATLTFNIAAR